MSSDNHNLKPNINTNRYDPKGELRENPIFAKWIPKASIALSASIIAYYIGNRTALHWPPVIPMDLSAFAIAAKIVGAFFGTAAIGIAYFIHLTTSAEEVTLKERLQMIFKVKYLKVLIIPFAFIAICEVVLAFL